MESVIVNGVDITNLVTSFEVYDEMDKSLLVGNAISTQIKIKLKNKDNQLQGLIDYPFIIDDKTYVVYEKPEKWTNIISVTLYDEMILTNVPYDTKLEYPTTLEKQLDEMIYITGVAIDKNSLSKEVLDKMIDWYDNTMLVRNYIAFIAQCDGKNAFIENDKITFIPIAIKTHQTNFCSDYELNELVNVTRVAYDDGIQLLAKGDNTGNTLYLSANNGYVDQSDIDRIYDMYNGISFFSFKKFKCREVTTIRLTELVQYHDIIILPLSIKKVVYGGEALNSLEMSGDITLKNVDSVVIKEDLSIKIKRIKVLVDQNNQTMEILAKEQDGLNKKVGSLELSNQEIKSSIQNIQTKIEDLTAVSTETTYQIGDSGTEPPTGTWLITYPEPVQGKYLWTKKVVTYENGLKNTSYDISYFGTDGTDGTSVSVTDTKVEYATSSDITNIPTVWNKNRPTSIPQGHYIWTRTTVNYSDGKFTIVYAWNYQGVDGTSIEISSQTSEYQASTSGTEIPDGIWSSSIVEVPQGQYLWTKNIITYSNGLVSTSYSVSYHGLDGSDAAIRSDTAPTDMTKMWFDTTDNLLKYWDGESWEVTNDYAEDLNNVRTEITTEYNSAITQLKESITSLVEELQTTTTDNSQAVNRLASQIEQNASSISFITSSVNSIVDNISGLATKEEISKWARFMDGVLELGASNSPFAVKLSNTELGFYQNGTRIAYLSNQMLNISQAVVMTKLKFTHYEINDVEIDGYYHLILK